MRDKNFNQVKNLKRQINILKATALTTYKEWAAYRSHMAVSVLVGPVFFLVQVFIWNAIYSTRETVTGLTLNQMLVYFGISAVIGYLTYDSSDMDLQMLIRTGKFITFMLRPVTHSYFAFSQKLGHRILALWVEFIPVYLLFLFVFKINLVPANIFWALVSITLSFILVFLTNYCIGITGFWLTKTEGLRRAFLVLRDICAGVFVPLTLFPDLMQKVLFFLPFQFITYVPIRVFIGSYELAGIKMSIPQIVGLQALSVVAMYLVYKLLWHLGTKRFTGVGA
ncbi:MAG TPA: ABC-2 family transporter protein [Pseudobacteroides sp.]|uniref:ABC transporter permease n=1 Tax=Pseudobacteroides sp. TaxID=1968840 RepID=UPI002F92CAB9